MCLIISLVFSYLAFVFFEDGNILGANINGVIALGFIALLIRNILKTKKEKSLK